MKKICVFGSYKDLDEISQDEIVRLGRLLAERGFTVVSGGFGGTMEYVSKGARLAGGRTIGVTYYAFEDLKVKKANPYIDEEIRTKDIFERITRMMELADGFICLPGGTGTLLELAAVMEHINKGLVDPKPIVAVSDFWRGVVRVLEKEPVLSQNTRSALNVAVCGELVTFVKDVDDAVRSIAETVE